MAAIARSPFAHRYECATPAKKTNDMIIRDLSGIGRTGFKGAGTTEWLASKVGHLPARPNRAITLADGTLIARLGKEEYLILDGRRSVVGASVGLEASWEPDSKEAGARTGYPLPRADSHSWLYLEGMPVPMMMAKICGVDLRDGTFAPGEVAQTIVARIGAILIREDGEGKYGLHMLTDFASADYLWDVLEDASAEFGGGFTAAGGQ